MTIYRVYVERPTVTFVGQQKREPLALPFATRESAQASADRLTRLAGVMEMEDK